MEIKNYSSNTDKAILFVTDDNFMKGLIAQINSAKMYVPDAKIYLVHNLSESNLNHVRDFIYKEERFDQDKWKHLSLKYGHVTKTNQGKLQVDLIEEENLLYMDTDAIIVKPFSWEYPDTMTLDIKKQPMDTDVRFYTELELLRQFVIEQGGKTEEKGNFTLFTDGAFFVNRQWMIETLRPKIEEMSRKYVEKNLPQRWYAMEFFHSAICVLDQPVKEWSIKQALPGIHYLAEKYPHLFPYKNLDECHFIHYLSYRKPWDFPMDKYPIEGGFQWWSAYLNGPVPPLDKDVDLEKIVHITK